MDIKTVTTGIVALIVTLLVVSLVAVPIVEDATTGTAYQGSNSGTDRFYTEFTGQAVEYIWTGGSGTVNGATSPNGIPVVSDKIILRASSTGWYWYDLTSNTYAIVHGTSTSAKLAVTAAGAYTLTSTTDGTETTLATGTLSKIWVSTTNGDWGYYTSGVTATLGATVYAVNFTNVDTEGPARMTAFVNGVQGSDIFSPWLVSGGAIVAGSAVTYDVDYTTNGEGQQVGKYTGQSVTSGDITTSNAQWIAPVDYKSTAVQGGEGVNATLLAIIPLLLFIVAVMMAVRLVRDA